MLERRTHVDGAKVMSKKELSTDVTIVNMLDKKKKTLKASKAKIPMIWLKNML